MTGVSEAALFAVGVGLCAALRTRALPCGPGMTVYVCIQMQSALSTMRTDESELNRVTVTEKPVPPPIHPREKQKTFLCFLLSSLYSRRYGKDLEWVDEEAGIFRVRWSCHPWISRRDAPVGLFKDWTVRLGKWNEEDPKNLSKAKSRVRATLLRHGCVQALTEDDPSYRRFKIESHQLLDSIKRKQHLRRQMKDGNLNQVKYCPVHKTAHASCCFECSTWFAPPPPIFEDQQDGTYACEEFELFCIETAALTFFFALLRIYIPYDC